MHKVLQYVCPTEHTEKIALMFSVVLLYGMLQGLLLLLRDRVLMLHAVATIAGHMCGFAAISAFEAIQEMVDELTEMELVISAFVALMSCLFALSGKLRAMWGPDAEAAEDVTSFMRELHKHHTWLEVCEELEDDALTLALGLLMSQAVRFLILGRLPPLHGRFSGRTSHQADMLLCAGLVCATMVAFSTCVRRRLQSAHREVCRQASELLTEARFGGAAAFVPTPENVCAKRVWGVVQGTLAMTTSWIFVFWGEWWYYLHTRQDKMVMQTILAVTTSIAVFPLLVVFSLECVSGPLGEERVFVNIVAALGLLVGLGWEKAFELALSGTVFESGWDLSGDGVTGLVCYTAMVDLLVAPAWMCFILPRAVAGLKRVAGRHLLWAGAQYEDSTSGPSGANSEAENRRSRASSNMTATASESTSSCTE
uniref:Uncharacterized protein n=1 Tax=Zooxanthella nutricula TaxID=1333877 RepID=A0A7S2MPA6_9DINO